MISITCPSSLQELGKHTFNVEQYIFEYLNLEKILPVHSQAGHPPRGANLVLAGKIWSTLQYFLKINTCVLHRCLCNQL